MGDDTTGTPLDVQTYRESIVAAAQELLRAQVVSASLHGNISVRLPGTDRILLTSASSLAAMTTERLAMLTLDGKLVGGELDPSSHEIVGMHTTVYQARPDIGAVLHTHPPMATSFAVASREIPCIYEAMVRFGLTDPIPVAKYGPRGSDESLQNIAKVIGPKTWAILLEHHGILAFGRTMADAVRIAIIMEESAELALRAAPIGGAKEIPAHLLQATQQRAVDFQQLGTQRVEGGHAH